jgi:hypothetical protein
MGSGRSGSLLASISSLITSPYVLFAAAAVVVIAVLIVLFMVLRGGSKKGQVASEFEEDQAGAWESAPHGAVGQPNKEYHQQDQMFPWQDGGGRADAGRQPAGGKRGPVGRDAQSGWDQPDGYSQGNGRWDAPAQPAARENERGWGGAPASAGNQGAWGQGPAAASGRGREQESWGQPPMSSAPMGREQDQWGQPAGRGREPAQNEWGQPAQSEWGQPAGRGREQESWGQPAQNEWGQPAGRGREPAQNGWGQPAQGEWGQPAGRGREPAQSEWGQPAQNDWGTPAPARGQEQNQWGQPAPAMARGPDQPDSMGGSSRRGQDGANRADDQWGQGNWAGGGPARNEAGGDRWGQPAQPGVSRPVGQSGPAGTGWHQGAGDGGSEWGQPRADRPAAGQPAGSWEQGEAPAWQAPQPQEPPVWQSAGRKPAAPEQPAPRSGSPNSHPQAPVQWGAAGGAAAPQAWEVPGAADEWGQPAQAPRSGPNRPVAPSGAADMGQPPIGRSAGSEWGERDFDRPTVRPVQPSAGWEPQEAFPRSPAQESAAPAWQAPPVAQAGSASGVASTPVDRRGPDMRPLGKLGPDATAYAVPAPEGDEGEAAKTVVMRKDTASERIPAIVVRQGKEPGRTYEMRKEQISIGRSRESDIFLEDLAVSRLHATIYRDEMGGYRLRDEHSANGTSVNGQRVSAEVALQEGDEVQLGQTILVFMRRQG